MDRMIYVVGSEQIHHFRSLFSIFKQLRFPFADKCYHLNYGMIYLPEGKMKSREGAVVDADDLRLEMMALAREEVHKRFPELNEQERARRAETIGMGALKFYVLKFDPLKDFTYDPAESISFTGDTGPYIQYTYARICSIFRRGEVDDITGADSDLLMEPLEHQLLAKLVQYPGVLAAAADQYRPSTLCQYLLELARLTNSYYHDVQVLVEKERLRFARLWLLHQVRETLKDGLYILGIDVLEEM
jgi:arginyl-tRNA synthetase